MPMVQQQRHHRQGPHIEGATTVLVDPDSDLILRTGGALESEHTTNFRVCSSTLRRCSPVFQAMLFGGLWAESWKPSPSSGLEWTVSLPYDSPRDMQVLLHITHANFDSVPLSPSTEELYRIIVLADKYALSQKLNPWVSRWLRVMRDRSAGDIKTEERVWMMRIAWHLGDEKLYLMQLKDFLLRACFVPAPDVSNPVEGNGSEVEVAEKNGEAKDSGIENSGKPQEVPEPVEEWLLRTEDDNCDLGLLLTAPGEMDCGMPDLPGKCNVIFPFTASLTALLTLIPEFIDCSRYESLISIFIGFNEETFGKIAPGKWKGHCRGFSSSDPDGEQSRLKCDAILLASILGKWAEDSPDDLGPARGGDKMPGKSLNSIMKWQIDYSAGFAYMPGHYHCTPKYFFEQFEKDFRYEGCWNTVLREGERSHLEERRKLFGITDDPEVLVSVDTSPVNEEDGVAGPKEGDEWQDVEGEDGEATL
ncbi:hypothetical protein QBC36DRAFT_327703 [Triangularia setosa]|uniref:BTB domain-containing protein n=1 Tax=Triangularia setosa TaxID=2587417 RepID=A0AAN6WAR4_9PEZI|nr:hypothetical protein QBC36DRAFT_327703 [Podospora setosa]